MKSSEINQKGSLQTLNPTSPTSEHILVAVAPGMWSVLPGCRSQKRTDKRFTNTGNKNPQRSPNWLKSSGRVRRKSNCCCYSKMWNGLENVSGQVMQIYQLRRKDPSCKIITVGKVWHIVSSSITLSARYCCLLILAVIPPRPVGAGCQDNWYHKRCWKLFSGLGLTLMAGEFETTASLWKKMNKQNPAFIKEF